VGIKGCLKLGETSTSPMESGAFAACAGLGLGLVILQQLFFATALRGFVAEERRKRAETAAQVLRSLEDAPAQRKHSPMKGSSGTGHRYKLHKTFVCDHSPQLTCSARKRTDHAASIRPLGSSSTPTVGVGSPHARDGVRSTKLASGCTKRAGTLPPLPSKSSGLVACPAHPPQRRRERPRETMAESGRPKISVSSGSRFYGNVVEEMVRKVRANRGLIAPPTTPL